MAGSALVTALERAREVVSSWEEELRRELPEGAHLFDAHTHLGNDIDGMVGSYDELIATLDRHGFAGAFMFCLDEHDREPAFSIPNDRTLAHARRSEGRLVPFVRLDLTSGPLDEARRCLDLGARGIKLHPRAQAFALSDERLQPVFALAVERSVPILIHGGRGLPPIAEDLEALVRRNEGVKLIVAHAGIADMAGLAGRLGGIPGVFFDTSVWSGLDLLDLYRQVAPEQVLYASDYPYGRQPNSLLVSVRTAKLAGFDDKQLRLMLGGSARRLLAGEELEPLSAPRGPTSLVQPLTFARIHQYISMAVPMLWLRQRDGVGALGLAVNASRERSNGHPDASERVEELLVAAQELWRSGVEIENDDERTATFRAAIQLVNLADMVSLTTRA
jgi:predicted TIM-barrel fold metal-dependent hydrolase